MNAKHSVAFLEKHLCVRVDAFARWPGMIEGDVIVGDMIHVADLCTTIARFVALD
jgi:arylsulfatase